jgi:hypothetical protein
MHEKLKNIYKCANEGNRNKKRLKKKLKMNKIKDNDKEKRYS